jgi:hypothetical protein
MDRLPRESCDQVVQSGPIRVCSQLNKEINVVDLQVLPLFGGHGGSAYKMNGSLSLTQCTSHINLLYLKYSTVRHTALNGFWQRVDLGE